MKILQNKSNRLRNSIIISSIILVIALLGVSYMYAKKVGIFSPESTSQQTQDKINLNPPTNEQLQAGSDAKKQTIENSQNAANKPSPTTKQTVAVTITASNVAGDNLSIRTLIDKVSNTGTCTLTMTAEGQATIVKTADVQALPSGATCKGFDIPLSELSGSKTWNVQIEYVSAEVSGKTTKVVNL